MAVPRRTVSLVLVDASGAALGVPEPDSASTSRCCGCSHRGHRVLPVPGDRARPVL